MTLDHATTCTDCGQRVPAGEPLRARAAPWLPICARCERAHAAPAGA